MKWRPPFIVIVGICALCVVVSYGQEPTGVASQARRSVQDDFLRRFARLAASYEMAEIHSEELESNREFVPLWGVLFQELRATMDVDASWKSRIIWRPAAVVVERAKEVDAPLTDFEKRAVKKIEQGASEVLEHPAPNSVLYLRPIRSVESCNVCHRPPEHGKRGLFSTSLTTKPMKIDDAMISLQITLEKKKGTGKQDLGTSKNDRH